MYVILHFYNIVILEDGLYFITNGSFGVYWDQVNANICKFKGMFIFDPFIKVLVITGNIILFL